MEISIYTLTLKKLKKLKTTFFYFLIVCLTSCSLNEDRITEVDIGTINNKWVYTNKTFGFKFLLPTNYYIVRSGGIYPDGFVGDNNYLNEVNKIGNKTISTSEFKSNDLLSSSTIISIYKNPPKIDITNPDNPSPTDFISVAAHIPKKNYSSEKEFIEGVYKNLTLSKIPISISDLSIDSSTFKTIKFEVNNTDNSTVKMFVAHKKYSNVFLTITIYYASDAYLKEALAIFSKNS